MSRPLVIVGAGGLARETAEAVHAINDVHPTWELLGFVDDSARLHGEIVDGLPVLGSIELVRDHPALLVVCTASPKNNGSRRAIVERLALPRERYVTLVHPTASVARSAAVGAGSVLLAFVVVTGPARIGNHVAMMPQVVVTHDDTIGDYVTVAAGVRLGGGVVIEDGAYLGSGCSVRENLTVGAGALIGMGAVVTNGVPAGQTWFGVPARPFQRDLNLHA